MSEEKGKGAAGDRGRLRAAREVFAGKPGVEALRASGEIGEVVKQGTYLAARRVVAELRKERERQGVSLGRLSELTGIDKAALSRLETGANANPTVDTLERYAQALGKHIVCTLADRVERPADEPTVSE
jgi:DNA-binding Xre family transcriptional regulator